MFKAHFINAVQPLLRRVIAILLVISCPDGNCTADIHRSPMDLIVSADESQIISVNSSSGTVSLIDVDRGKVLSELAAGTRPWGVASSANSSRIFVTDRDSGELFLFDMSNNRLQTQGKTFVGIEPMGVAATRDGRRAYVALRAEGAVAVVDIDHLAVTKIIPVGHWPTYVALSPDESRLAVAVHGECGIAVVDTASHTKLFLEDFQGINFGQMQTSSDGKFVYFPWMVYRRNPITPSNIRQGWVLASRVARVRLDEHKRREAISLDPQGQAVSDPHGLALSGDGQRMVVTAGGTHELLLYKLEGLPFQDYGGPGDHINRELLADSNRFYRIPLGGRPMGVRLSKDGSAAFVANYLLDAIQVVDLETRSVTKTILLGRPKTTSLVRKGEELFCDGKRSLDQWYSCHSCHYDGLGNSVTIDTRNDGSSFTFKSVPSLINVTKTGPWMWHGWQGDLGDAVHKSFTETMLGPAPTKEETTALLAYLGTLRSKPKTRGLNERAKRGQGIFAGKGLCADCHRGPYLTDGEIHDVGTGKDQDVYDGFNTPSLIGIGSRTPLLHDGQLTDLSTLLDGPHSPAVVKNGPKLSEMEIADLVAFLETL